MATTTKKGATAPATSFRPNWRDRNCDLPPGFNDLPEADRERVHAERVRLLYVYAASAWHSPIHIVGNRNALTVLRDALDAALTNGKASTSAMATDGEGYAVEIEMDDRAWTHPSWETRPTHYTSPIAAEGPDPEWDIRALRASLRLANAALVKRGVRPIPDPTQEVSGEHHG